MIYNRNYNGIIRGIINIIIYIYDMYGMIMGSEWDIDISYLWNNNRI